MTKAIVISSGHGKFVRGASRFIDEVDEARKVVDRVAKYLREHGATVYVYHDDTSKSQRDNLNAIVRYHNSKQRVLDVSVHFNAASVTEGPRGCEVLYYDAKSAAANVSKAIAIAGGFKDRGAKERRDLAFTANTNKPALLLEVCFVDSKADVELYRRNFDAICVAIAVALAKEAGITLNKPQVPEKPKEETSAMQPTQTLLNATGRADCKEMIKRGVAERLFTSKHENIDKYTDIELISYAMSYVNRKTK